jgi:predicted AlkP superfamily pyrophosphatase or phosphodiesterase
MTCVAPTVAALLQIPAPAATTGEPIPEVVESLGQCTRVAILAPDALGLFPWTKWRNVTPFLNSMHECHSLRLRSVMPTITPVNFATMISGVPREVHGIGSFKDDFACETLFDVLAAEGLKGAGVGRQGWTGGELLARYAQIGGVGPGDDDGPLEALVLDAAAQGADFIIAQIGETDKAFHRHGPSSPEVEETVRSMDGVLMRLTTALRGLGYAVLILSDHGQHDTEKGGSHGTEADEDALVPLTWAGPGACGVQG